MIDVINKAAITATDDITGETIVVPAVKRWELTIPKADIFTGVSLKVSYINDKKPIAERNDSKLLTEDDQAIFDKYLAGAIADLNIILAKYYLREFNEYEIDDTNIYMNLSLNTNFKDSVAFSLNEYVKEFLELLIQKKWFGPEAYQLGLDVELRELESKLKSAINFRATPVRRPIHPIF